METEDTKEEGEEKKDKEKPALSGGIPVVHDILILWEANYVQFEIAVDGFF